VSAIVDNRQVQIGHASRLPVAGTQNEKLGSVATHAFSIRVLEIDIAPTDSEPGTGVKGGKRLWIT
jgi:hypothetical protein